MKNKTFRLSTVLSFILEINPCDENPCHKGRCVVDRDDNECIIGYHCECYPYYTGDLCNIG